MKIKFQYQKRKKQDAYGLNALCSNILTIPALCNLDVHSGSTWPQQLTKTLSAVVSLLFLLLADR